MSGCYNSFIGWQTIEDEITRWSDFPFRKKKQKGKNSILSSLTLIETSKCIEEEKMTVQINTNFQIDGSL